MVEPAGDLITRPRVVLETQPSPPNTYQELTTFFNALDPILQSADAHGQVLNWEGKLRGHFRGRINPTTLTRLVIIGQLLGAMRPIRPTELTQERRDAMMFEGAEIQQKFSKIIAGARKDPRALALLSMQVEALSTAFTRSTEICGYRREILNGLRGMVAARIALQELGYGVKGLENEELVWDVYHDIDLLMLGRGGREFGVSVECFQGGKLKIERVPVGDVPPELRMRLKGKLDIDFPAPTGSKDPLWSNSYLGIPSDTFIHEVVGPRLAQIAI